MNTDFLRSALLRAKRLGFSDAHLARLWGLREGEVRSLRGRWGIKPVYKTVDTCAAEFEAYTPYFYSSYERPHRVIDLDGQSRWETESEITADAREKIIILGGGPNRIGQGIEFDYCCVHAVFALREEGYFTIMVNSNPETVSTDYDTSDRLYFEPLTLEDVLNIVEAEKPKGVIIQFGGQTPLKLALGLEEAGVPILGTSPRSIDLAEDRRHFNQLLRELDIKQPPGGTARSREEARVIAKEIGYPVLVRPSYVLGGRAMEIVHDQESLETYMDRAFEASPDHPVLVDRFLLNAIEMDVDAVSDGNQVYIGGIMEHIEYAGIHSGDSACRLPPASLLPETVCQIEEETRKLALALNVCGLINIQYAVAAEGSGGSRREEIYVLEVNPRASRTVPYVSKATGVPLAKVAARCMVGRSLEEQGLKGSFRLRHVAVKEAVLPFVKFRNVDPVLGPEMRSTGEVMGIAPDFGTAFAKSQAAAGAQLPLPESGNGIFISIGAQEEKEAVLHVARGFQSLGFPILATEGTREYLTERGLDAELVFKIGQGRPNVLDRIKNREIGLVINTPRPTGQAQRDESLIRRSAVETGVAYTTTLAGARSCLEAIHAGYDFLVVKSLQEYQEQNR